MVRQRARVTVDGIGMIWCFVMRNLRVRLVDVLYVGVPIPVEVCLIYHECISGEDASIFSILQDSQVVDDTCK